MKAAFFLLAVVIGVAVAQNLVSHEVHAIIQADSSITVAECTKKCDDIFGLIDPMDESMNDRQCAHECDCQINHTCGRPTRPPTTRSA